MIGYVLGFLAVVVVVSSWIDWKWKAYWDESA